MKKILTIAATTGAVLSAFVGLAQAETVNFPGNVTQYCEILSKVDGTLTENSTTGATSLATLTPGSVLVKCNTTTSKLDLSPGVHAIPPQTSTPTVSFGLTNPGTGIYLGTVAGSQTFTAADVTTSTGDTAYITATITALPNKLLAKGAYKAIVIATLTP